MVLWLSRTFFNKPHAVIPEAAEQLSGTFRRSSACPDRAARVRDDVSSASKPLWISAQRSSGLALRLKQSAVDQRLGDLHGVEGCALAQVVGDAPEGEAVLDRDVLADARDVGGVLAGRLMRRDVAAGLAAIDHDDAGRGAQ